MKQQDKNKKRTEILAAVCFTMSLVLLLSSFGATLAKYIKRSDSTGAAVAAPFYFTSDKLKAGGDYVKVNQPVNGVVEISFTLSNYVDHLRCTRGTINYNYWVVSGRDPNSAKVITGEPGSISGEFQTTPAIDLQVPASAFAETGEVTVFARSELPYAQTISATFGFEEPKYDLQWQVTEEKGAVVLEIAGGSGADVTVTWTSDYYPDISNPVFQGAGAGTLTFQPQPGVRYALTFLKADPDAPVLENSFSVS